MHANTGGQTILVGTHVPDKSGDPRKATFGFAEIPPKAVIQEMPKAMETNPLAAKLLLVAERVVDGLTFPAGPIQPIGA